MARKATHVIVDIYIYIYIYIRLHGVLGYCGHAVGAMSVGRVFLGLCVS